jgi:hypothetical protein
MDDVALATERAAALVGREPDASEFVGSAGGTT